MSIDILYIFGIGGDEISFGFNSVFPIFDMYICKIYASVEDCDFYSLWLFVTVVQNVDIPFKKFFVFVEPSVCCCNSIYSLA